MSQLTSMVLLSVGPLQQGCCSVHCHISFGARCRRPKLGLVPDILCAAGLPRGRCWWGRCRSRRRGRRDSGRGRDLRPRGTISVTAADTGFLSLWISYAFCFLFSCLGITLVSGRDPWCGHGDGLGYCFARLRHFLGVVVMMGVC